MARNQYTSDQIEAIAKELLDASRALSDIASGMRESGIPNALLHGTLTEKTHIPAIIDWVGKSAVDVKSQIRSYLTDTPSRAELHKQKNENQKLAAAKKPWKKATKKKS